MRNLWHLLRDEPRARPFFIAHAQSSLGNGAAYVALLLLVYERFDSALAVALVLLADFVPAMLLGPLLGAASDRWGRRKCMIVSDVLRAVAFALLALTPGLGPMLALALVAGFGTALFMPAANAMLPRLVDKRRLPAANGLFGGSIDAGLALGPIVAVPALLIAGPEAVLLANAATFVISAVLLFRLPRDAPSAEEREDAGSLLAEAREGIRIAARLPVVRVALSAAAAGVLFGAAVNVGEVALAIDHLGVGATGYAVLVAVNSLGTVIGSIAASGALSERRVARRFVAGLALEGAALAAAGVGGVLAAAVVAFAVAGFANGFGLTYERTLLQMRVPDDARGRVFGVRDALNSWGFGLAFVFGGLVIAELGAAAVFIAAGTGLVVVAALASVPLGRVGQAPAYDLAINSEARIPT